MIIKQTNKEFTLGCNLLIDASTAYTDDPDRLRKYLEETLKIDLDGWILMNSRFYNKGYYGWNWSGFLFQKIDSSYTIGVISNMYRNIPKCDLIAENVKGRKLTDLLNEFFDKKLDEYFKQKSAVTA